MTTSEPPRTQSQFADARTAETQLEAMFVGGPLDGQTMKFDRSQYWIRHEAVWPFRVDSLDFLKSLSMPPDDMLLAYRHQTVRYEFTRWQIGPIYVNLMIPEGWLYGHNPDNPLAADTVRSAVVRAVVKTTDAAQIQRIA